MKKIDQYVRRRITEVAVTRGHISDLMFDFDFSPSLTKTELLFLADLEKRFGHEVDGMHIDQAYGNPVEVTAEENTGWFLCSVRDLEKRSGLKWTKTEQAFLISSLKQKGYLQTQRRGIPAKRWVRVVRAKLFDDVEREVRREYVLLYNKKRGRTNG